MTKYYNIYVIEKYFSYLARLYTRKICIRLKIAKYNEREDENINLR